MGTTLNMINSNPNLSMGDFNISLSFFSPGKGEQIGEVAAMKIWETWVDIVHEYTHRVLTRGDDKLPAIASFAAEFQPIIGGKYFAGLWRRYLIPGLL